MAVVEAFAVLGVISAVISIADGIKQVYDAASDPKGLPPAFKEVANRMPLVKNTLQAAENGIKADSDAAKGMEMVMDACKTKAEKLEDIFRKVLPEPDASRMDHYLTALRGYPKGSRVELLMKGILEDIQLLASNHGMKTVTKDEMEQLAKAIKIIEDIPPSADDELVGLSSFTNIHHGSGDHSNYQAMKDMYINPGSGSMYIATNQNFSGSGKNP